MFDVPVAPYEGGSRPSSEVVLEGDGASGRGENVAWTPADHVRFARQDLRFHGRLADLELQGTPYERAALEGALIDLALRQNDVRLGGEGALQTWVSFDRCTDPAARAARILERNPGARFKIDVDPSWTVDTLTSLASVGLAVLDFKHAPDPTLARLAREIHPDVLFEDPPVVVGGPIGRDQVVLLPDDARVAPGERVNLKAPRLGGWLALLRTADVCEARGTPLYFGGMFELGVGRSQAQRLAVLLAPDAWHDLAAIPVEESLERRAARVKPAHGFHGPDTLLPSTPGETR